MLDKIKLYASQFPDPTFGPHDYPICQGGDLQPERLLGAYFRGFFPWYNATDPIYWWSPNPRCVLFPSQFKLPARSKRYIKNNPFSLTFNAAFEKVIESCAKPRKDNTGTWLNEEMIEAYTQLHYLGYAHSLEAWNDNKLVGGLYGVWLGQAFFGESMFHTKSEASRAALWGLVDYLKRNKCEIIDCQQNTPHIMKMGACNIERQNFLKILGSAIGSPDKTGAFKSHHECLNYDPVLDIWQPKS